MVLLLEHQVEQYLQIVANLFLPVYAFKIPTCANNINAFGMLVFPDTKSNGWYTERQDKLFHIFSFFAEWLGGTS